MVEKRFRETALTFKSRKCERTSAVQSTFNCDIPFSLVSIVVIVLFGHNSFLVLVVSRVSLVSFVSGFST